MPRRRIDYGASRGRIPVAAQAIARVIVLSPHLDDGVMSCGCLIATLARRTPVTVATIFAGRPSDGTPSTEWDRAAGFGPPHSDAVGARRREDRRALAALHARPRWLPFRDSQYGPSPRASHIAKRLNATLGRARGMLLFPLGLFHSDHRLTREAVLAFLRRRGAPGPCYVYEDAHYRRIAGLRDAALARLRRGGFGMRPATAGADPIARRRKARAVACYASQLRALATPGRLGHEDAFAPERYWRLTFPARRTAPWPR